MDGVTIGTEILKTEYLKATGLTWKDIKDLRSPCNIIPFKDIIFDLIEFKHPTLVKLLKDLKNVTLNLDEEARKDKDKRFQIQFELAGEAITYSTGGIHNQARSEIFIPSPDEILVDIDVASMYPSLILAYCLYPQHLGEAFANVYADIKRRRLEAKRTGNKLVDAVLKLSLNGVSGNLQSPYSWLYDPKAALTMRINGQLMLLMLTERLIALGARLINLNTDGAFVVLPRVLEDKLNEICREWETQTKLELEADYFERFYQFAINDYVGVKRGYAETQDPKLIKKKGLFIDQLQLGKGMAPLIIPKAINDYFVKGIPVETTVHNCTDITQFLTYQKVSKDFSVEYGGELCMHINRYYASTKGKSIYKCKVHKENVWETIYNVRNNETGFMEKLTESEYLKRENVTLLGKTSEQVTKLVKSCYISMCSSPVTLYNIFDKEEIPISERHINYSWYLSEIYKVINKMRIKQLTLF